MKQSDNKYLNALYKAVSQDYEINDLDDFRARMEDDTKRKKWYDAIKDEYELQVKDFDEFSERVLGRPTQTSQPGQTSQPAQSELVDNLSAMPQYNGTPTWRQAANANSPIDATSTAGAEWRDRQARTDEWDVGGNIAKGAAGTAAGLNGAGSASATANAGGLTGVIGNVNGLAQVSGTGNGNVGSSDSMVGRDVVTGGRAAGSPNGKTAGARRDVVTGDAGTANNGGAGGAGSTGDNAGSSADGTPMTDEERIAMMGLAGQMAGDVKSGVESANARLGRIARAATPEGLREAAAGRVMAATHGTPTHVIGFAPAPAEGADGSGTDNGANGGGNSAVGQLEKKLQVGGMSPQPHGVVYENGKPVTRWLLPDGTLTTSLLDASHAEYGAMESRLAEKFVSRMRENGLDPAKEEDVKRQEQLDYEAPIRNALDAVWRKAEEDDRKADEEYRNDMEKSRGGGLGDMIKGALQDASALDASGLPMRTPTDARRDLKREVKRRETFDLGKIADEVYEAIPSAYRDERLKEYSAYYRSHSWELDGRTVADAAKDALRGEAYGMVYERAVQARLPKSKTEFLWRKLADQPMLSEAMATNMAASGLTGNYALEAAEMEAMGRYGAKHKTLDIVGTVANMAMDPTTYISGAVGGAAGKATLRGLARLAAGRSMAKGVIDRWGLHAGGSLAARMFSGMGAGAGNFATFETLRNAQEQLRLGGSLDEETGERAFSAGDLLSATGRGLLMGYATGMFSPIIGNVADKVVKSATSTAGKVGARAGEVAVSTIAEGTIFAIPELVENDMMEDGDPGRRSNWDIWTDNMAMMLGFKASHALKSAPRVIAELAPVAEPKTMAERNRNRMGFIGRLRDRMDASPRDLDMTDEEISELHKYGYNELGDLFKRRPGQKAPEAKDEAVERAPYLEAEKALNEFDDYAVIPNEFDGYAAMEQLMQDGRVSQAARAKAYYILTGRMLPMGTVTGCTREVAGNGDIYVTAMTANGEAVTRRRFGSEAAAKAEEARIMRTAELNSIDAGERYRETQANVRTLRTVVEAVAPGADFETVMQTYKKVKDGDEAATEAYGEMVAKIDEALAQNRGMFDGERPAAIREAVKKETGVDVDKAIRKTIDGRTEAEAGAVKEYLKRLYGDETKREAEAAYDNAGINWGRVEEGDAGAKAEADNIVRTADEAERNCEAAFGAEAERRMAEMKSDAWSMLSDLSLTEEQRAAVKEYIKATEALRGMTDAANEHADERRAAVRRDVERRTNRETGMIVPAVMKVGDRKVYVVKGRIVQHSDKSGIDVRDSDKEILVYDPERDAVEFASPDQVLNLEDTIDPSVEIERAMNDIQREQEEKMQPQATPRVYNLNEELTLDDEEGKPMRATIVAGANEDGLYQVQTDKPINGRVVNLMSGEQIDALLHKEATGDGQESGKGSQAAGGNVQNGAGNTPTSGEGIHNAGGNVPNGGESAPGNGGNVHNAGGSVPESGGNVHDGGENVQTAGAGGAVSEATGTHQAGGNAAGGAEDRAEKTVRGVRNKYDGTYSKIYEDGSEATFDMENRLVSEKPAPTDRPATSETGTDAELPKMPENVTVNGDGTYTVANGDGSRTTYGADGKVVAQSPAATAPDEGVSVKEGAARDGRDGVHGSAATTGVMANGDNAGVEDTAPISETATGDSSVVPTSEQKGTTSEATAESGAGAANATAASGQTGTTAASAAGQSVAPAPRMVNEPMPMIGEGENAEPDFKSATPLRAHDYLYNESGLDEETANDFVDNNLAEAEKAVKRLAGKKPKIGTSIAKFNKENAEWKKSVAEANAMVEYWNQVKLNHEEAVAMQASDGDSLAGERGHETTLSTEEKPRDLSDNRQAADNHGEIVEMEREDGSEDGPSLIQDNESSAAGLSALTPSSEGKGSEAVAEAQGSGGDKYSGGRIDAAEAETDGDIVEAVEKFKAKDPDVMVMVRKGNMYHIYGEDAKKAAVILGIGYDDHENPKLGYEAQFPLAALDVYLPRVIHAGVRVAIDDMPEKKYSKKEAMEMGERRKAVGKETAPKGTTPLREGNVKDSVVPDDAVTKVREKPDVASQTEGNGPATGGVSAKPGVKYSITATTYTNKKGKETPMSLVKFDGELTREQERALNEFAKERMGEGRFAKVRGWRDRESGGWLFRSEEDARKAAAMVNDEEALQDGQPLTADEMREAAGLESATTTSENGTDVTERPANEIDLNEATRPADGLTETTGRKKAETRKPADGIHEGAGQAPEVYEDKDGVVVNPEVENHDWSQYKEGDLYDYEGYKSRYLFTDRNDSGTVTGVVVEHLDADGNAVGRESVPPLMFMERYKKVGAKEDPTQTGRKLVITDEMQKDEDVLRDLLGIGDDEVDDGMMFRDPEGLTPEQKRKVFAAGVNYALGYIDQGYVTFPEFARAMAGRLGYKIKPWLKSFYEGAKRIPGYETLPFTPTEEVDRYDVENMDKPSRDTMAEARMVAEEAKARAAADKANKELKETRNERRKENDEQRAADTVALAEEAGAVASEAGAVAKGASDERTVSRGIEKVDEALGKVSNQLALLGYYKADEVEKDYNEATGYMRNAERKAVKDAAKLAGQLIDDLGLDRYEATHGQADRKGNRKTKPLATANIAPAGGDVTIRLPLTEGRELYINIAVDTTTARGVTDYGGSNLQVMGIMYRVENPNGSGDRYGRNCFVDAAVKYGELLRGIERETYKYLPARKDAVAGEYKAGDKVEYTTDGGRTWSDGVVVSNETDGIIIDSGYAPVMYVNVQPDEVRHKGAAATAKKAGADVAEQKENGTFAKAGETAAAESAATREKPGNGVAKGVTDGMPKQTDRTDVTREMPRQTEKADLPRERQGEAQQKPGGKVAEKPRMGTEQAVSEAFNGALDSAEERGERTAEQRKFAMAVKDDMLAALENGTKPYRSIVDLRKRAKGLGMDVDAWGRTDILLQELVEDGLVRAAREAVSRYGRESKEAYDAVCKLYEMQPTIAARSSNRIKMQQYSTPLPMAWNAAHFAMSGKADGKVLEPTAGNGMLVFAVPAEQVRANELDGTRLANLREQGFGEVTNQDATLPFEGGRRYDVVIANPPFGPMEAKEYDGKLIGGLDPQITLNALEAMKDDGRAAIIIGGNMEYAENGALKGQKAFLTYLYDHYNVKGVVDMDGKLYQKQGTSFPTRMILIEGRRSAEERTQSVVYPPVQSKAVRKAESFGDLYDIVNEIINSKEKTNGTEVLRSQQRQPVSDPVGRAGRGDRMADTGQHRTDDGDGRGRGRGTDSKGAVPGGERVLRGASGPDNGDGSEGLRAGGDNRGRGRGADGPVAGGVDRMGAARGGVGLTQPQERRNTATKGAEKRTLTAEKLSYRPHNSAFSLESVAPAAMVEAMDKTLARIEEQYGPIDEFVTSELGYDTVEEAHNALAAEQMDSVAMAIYQMKQGQALIIGDQTGVGKGRQMAALIRWAVKQGKKPIFMTQKADLFSDIYRDLVDVGSGDLVPFIFNSPTGKENRGEMVDANGNVVYKGLSDAKQKEVFATGELPEECDYAVLTYSQVNTGDEQSRDEARQAARGSGKRMGSSKSDGKAAPKATFLRKIAKGNYLFLDESHTAAGESNTGAYLQSIVREAKACTFASATFAKRPDTMPLYALRTAMSKAKLDPGKLINVIASGGVTLQEIMSRELTAAGQMVRRERDMSGVKTDWKTISDEATVKRARENYDKTIEAFNAIIKFQKDHVEPYVNAQSRSLAEMASSAGLKQGTENLGAKNEPFASKTYNYTKQLMLALKADAIVDEVTAEIEAGRHPVIALESTMEANIEDYNDGEVIAEPTFSASLLRGLDSVMQYTVNDSNGKKKTERLSPEDLGSDGAQAYYELESLIRKATADVYISPLDDIITKLRARGYKVGELTGRDKYVELTEDGRSVVRKRTDKDKKRMQREFNSGALDVLILNKSVSTGISLHASEKFSDQRQRTMIIAQPLSDINDYMQMIGRIDRTGQVHRGYYINLGLPVPAESRFLMMLSTKLKSLNANTTTSQDSESNEVAAPDMLNKYGSQVAIEYLRDNPDIYEKMGKPLKGGLGKPLEARELDGYKPQEDDARRITGCAALLSTKEQDDFYNDVTRRYNELINYLNETGSNDLKITVMPLRAETKEKRVTSRGTDPNGENPFAKDAYVETVEMDVLRKPMKAADVKKVMEQVCRGMDPKDYLEQVTETLRNEAYGKIDAENERYEKAKEKMGEEVAKQTEKINASEKLTDEEKQNAIANYEAGREAEVENRHKANVDRIKATGNDLYRKLRKFETGKSYLVPDSLEGSMFNTASPAIFCGYKTKEQKITASTTLAVFATLDGRRRVEVKLSEDAALNRIEKMTLDNLDSARRTTLENWDSQIPTETRKTGHILTGNILQAIADTQDETGHFQGQLISYTDMEGNIHDGILMPDKWKVSSLKSSGIPLAARIEQIKNYETVVSRDGKVRIEGSRWSGFHYLSVPRTKKEGAIYFDNKTILKNVVNQIFYPYRGQLRADIPVDKIEPIVKELTRLGVTVKDETLEKEEEGMKFRTSEELNAEWGDRWLSEQTNEDGRHTTQVKNTINSYKKFGEWVKADSKGRDVTILDASSGLGLGTEWMRENGMKVDDVEPYPSEDRAMPTFMSYGDIDKKYDYIISNAVLNVIPDDWRRNVLHDMADKLKEGGKLVINVRGAAGIAKQGKEGVTRITLDDASEILVLRPDGSIKAYQKGFTKPELKEWCENELGEGYRVEIASKDNAGDSYDTAVVVTKNNGSGTIGTASEVGHPRRSAQPMLNSAAKLAEFSDITKGLNSILASLSENGELGAHELLFELSKAFGHRGSNLNKSYYKELGEEMSIRFADHYANSGNFDEKNEHGTNYGVVIKLSANRFKDKDGVDYLEYVYFPDKLDEERQFGLVDGLKAFVETGKFEALPRPDKVHASGRFKAELRELQTDENAMTERVTELAESLNTPIRIVRTEEEVAQLPSARQRRMKGSFNPRTGEVTVVVPNNENVADVENTVLHEVVGHDGLRVLFPEEEKLNNALDELYNASEEGIRQTIDGTARKMYDAEVERLRAQMRKEHEAKGEDAEASYYADMAAAHAEAGKKKEQFRRAATEEYGADLAGRIGEEGFEKMSREEQTFWGRLKAMLQKALGRLLQGLGIPKMKAWTDKEWAFVLHEAYKRKKNGGRPDVFDMADTEVMRHKTGFDESVMKDGGREERTSAAEKGLLFRDGDPEMRNREEVREQYERKMHNGLYQTQEAFQDSMLALKEAMEMTVGKGTYIEDIADYENPYLGENRLSRVNKAENDIMERTLFKPLYEEVAKLAKDKAERLELTDYMMAKHGLERNDVMARRAAQKVVREEYEDRIKVAEAAVNNDPLDQDAIDTLDALKKEAATREAELYAENRQRDYSGLTTLMSTEPSVHAIQEQIDALKEQLQKESDPDARKNMREQISLLKLQLLDAAEDEAKKFVDKYETDHETTELWNRVNAVNGAILDKQYESGLISEATYKDISGMYTHYIPLRGFDEKTSDEVYAYINHKESVFNAPVKKAKGRTSKADDPIANMRMMAESGIAAGNRNTLVKQRMLNFVLNHPTDLVSVGELWLQHDDVTDEWVPVIPDNIDETDSPAEVEQKMADFEQKMEGLAKSDPSHYKHGKDAEGIPYRVLGMKEKHQHVVIAKRGGKDYVMTVNGNPRLAQALNGLTNPDNDSQGAVGKIISVVGGVNRMLSGLYTTYQPDFMASNFARDAVYANSMVWVKESPKYARAFNKNYMTLPRSMSLLGKYRKGELDPRNKTHVYFDEFMRNGGEVGFMRMLDIEEQKKKLQKKLDAMNDKIPARAVCECIGTWLGEIGRGIEMRARFAAYVTSREAGRSVGRSIWDASEISVNFPKKGAGDRFLNATGQTKIGNVAAGVSGVGRAGYIFWNAALQGTFGNFLKTALRHPKKMSVMASIALTAGFLVPALAKLRDDEEDSYFDIPKHTRRQNLVVKMPLESWLKMPLSIEQRSIYGLGEMLGCAVFNNEPLEAEDVMVQLSQLLPVDMMEGGDALWPSAVKPAVEAASNETWYGSPIWKETTWNEHDPNWTKAYKSANPDLVALAEWLNESKLSGGDKYSGGRIDLNPAQTEYLLKQYTGGFFTVVNQVRNLVGVATGEKDFDWRYVPLANRAVMSGGDERNAGQGLNGKFFHYMDEYEALNRRFSNIKNDRGVDFEEKGRLLGEVLKNPVFLTMRRYETQYRKLQTAINESRSLGQEDHAKELEKQMKELKQKAVSEMEGQ